MLDMHIFEHGYTEIYLPLMVRSKVFEGAGVAEVFDNIYRDAEEDFMFLGTAEIALTNLFADEILDEAQLPIKLVAHTACFRREKMSAGGMCAASSAVTSLTRSRCISLSILM